MKYTVGCTNDFRSSMANRASVSRKAPVVAAKYGGAWSNDASPPTSNATRHLATHGPKYHFPADPLYYIGRIPLDIMKQSAACMQVTLGPDASATSPCGRPALVPTPAR